MFWLISTSRVQPGEFYYRQTEGVSFSFENTPLVNELAAKVSAFRQANNLPRQSYSECYADIVLFTVARLNNDPAYCIDIDAQPQDLVPNTSTNCGSCGAVVK
jgi:hypothetical protein